MDYKGPAEFSSFREKALITWKGVAQKINFKLD
jgi:hypothetical protein